MLNFFSNYYFVAFTCLVLVLHYNFVFSPKGISLIKINFLLQKYNIL
jgi:hypothetical protein